jgi:hypothetical protein
MIRRHAALLASNTFNMGRAAKALVEWVEERNPEYEALDVSYCAIKRGTVVRQLVPRPDIDDQAVALEIYPGTVCIGAPPRPKVPGRSRFPKASPEARFVYPMARELVHNHKISWGNAIVTATACWRNTPAGLQMAVQDAEAVDAPGENDEHEGGVMVASDDEFEELTDVIVPDAK